MLPIVARSTDSYCRALGRRAMLLMHSTGRPDRVRAGLHELGRAGEGPGTTSRPLSGSASNTADLLTRLRDSWRLGVYKAHFLACEARHIVWQL
jgi:hypothetical protein